MRSCRNQIKTWPHTTKLAKLIAVVAIVRELAGFIWDISRLAMSLAVPRSAAAA
jgi:hypothetical protein